MLAMSTTITVDIPGATPEQHKKAAAWLLAYFEQRGITPDDAATSSFNRELHSEAGVDVPFEVAEADAWDGAEKAVCKALGLKACSITLDE